MLAYQKNLTSLLWSQNNEIFLKHILNQETRCLCFLFPRSVSSRYMSRNQPVNLLTWYLILLTPDLKKSLKYLSLSKFSRKILELNGFKLSFGSSFITKFGVLPWASQSTFLSLSFIFNKIAHCLGIYYSLSKEN